jgi:zinc protease
VFAIVNYGKNHILGIPESGTEETVQNITLQDIENYYNQYTTSNGARLVVVGDIKQEEVLSKLSFLNKLPNKKITLPKPEPAPTVGKAKVYLVDVPKGAQTEFRIGYPTGMKYDPLGDYYKAYLANYILGGAFNSRLNLKLREDKGWTYGARSGFYSNKYGGDFQFASGIKAAATDSALAEVMNDLKTYLKEGPTKDETAFMKSAINQSDARNYETGIQKARFIARILEYNLPPNYVELQTKLLKSMTPEQLKAVANKYIQPEKLNILLVGDKENIEEGAKKMGYEVVQLDADGNKIEAKTF